MSDDRDFARSIGAAIGPESLDWQHLAADRGRSDRSAWALGALDFDLVPPGGIGRWRLVGPAPITTRNEQMFTGSGTVAGQVRDLAIDPRVNGAEPTLYAACNSAGVWKSEDGGASWKPLNDQLPSLRIGAIALDPDNPDIVYAGSGNLFDGSHGERRGAGLFKSADGGKSWAPIDGGPGGSRLIDTGINRIVALTGGRVVIATAQRLALSTDGGASFALQPSLHPGFIGQVALDSSQRTVRRVRDVSATDPVVLGCTRHGFRTGDIVYVGGVPGPTVVNGQRTVRIVDADHIEVTPSLSGAAANTGFVEGPAHERVIAVTGGRVPGANLPVELTAVAHGLLAGDIVAVQGVQGLTGADGSWVIDVIDADHVRLRGSRGGAAYTGGGTIAAADVALEMAIVAMVDDPGGAIVTVHEHGFAVGDRTVVTGVAAATGDVAATRVLEVLDADRVRLRNVHLNAAFAGAGTLRRPPAVWNTLLVATNGFFDRDDGSGANNFNRGLHRITFTAGGPVQSTNLLANAGGFTATYNRVAFGQGGCGASRTIYALVQHGGVAGITTTNRLRAFLRSGDGGQSWTQPGNLLTVTNGWEQRQSHYDLLLAADPRNARRLYAGLKQIWVSTDAGDHWPANMPASEGGVNVDSILNRALAPSLGLVHWDQHVFAHLPAPFWPADPALPVPLYAGNDGGLVRTDDAGASYRSCNEGIASALLLSLDIGRGAGRNDVSAGGMWDNGTASHRGDRDGALRWQLAVDGDGGAVAVDPADPLVIYGFNNGDFVRSRDGGNHWSSNGDLPILELRNTNPVEVVVPNHALQTGDQIQLLGLQGGGGVTAGTRTVTRIDPDTFSVNGANATAQPAYVHPPQATSARWRREFAVVAATLSQPIQIETAETNGLATGDQVQVLGVAGPTPANSTPANPWWTITAIDPKRFSLDGSNATGSPPYQPGTGTVRGPRVAAQPVPILFAAPMSAPAGPARSIAVTAPGHRFVSGEQVTITGVPVVAAANVVNHPITVVDADTFLLDGQTTTLRYALRARVRHLAIGVGLPTAGKDTFVRLALVPNGANRATRVFVSSGRNLYRSDDGGRNFALVHQNFPGVVTVVYAPDAARLWIGTAQFTQGANVMPGEVWFSRDGGAHWLDDTHDNFIRRSGGRGSVSAIAEDPRNAQRVAVTFAGYSGTDPRFRTRHAFVSTTAGIRNAGVHPWDEIGGTSFAASGNLPDLPVLCVAFDPTANPSDLLVGTDLGVLRQVPGGWQRLGSNLPRVSVQAIAVDALGLAAPAVVRIATYGRGVWELERPPAGALDVVCDGGFAPTVVGRTRRQPLVLHNTGSAALQVSELKLLPGPNAFSIDPAPALPLAIPPGEIRRFEIVYAPAAMAVEDLFLSIKSDDPVTPDRFINVRGSSRAAGAVARAVVTPRVRFGATLVGRQRDLSVVIENVGDVPLRVNGVGLTGAVAGLTVDANPPRPIALATGARTQLDLHYAPAAVDAQGFREDLFLDLEDAGGQVIETRFVPVRGSAHSAATDLLTNLLAALGLADLPPDEAIV
jgi:hypothetical protein